MKKHSNCFFLAKRKILKTLLMMKFIAIFSLIFALNASASVYSQGGNISLDMKNKNLTEIFKEIQKQTAFTFLYSNELMKTTDPVNVKANNKALEEILKICLKGTNLSYEIRNDVVLIKKAKIVQQKDRTIKGKIIDAKTGEVLPGASIIALKDGNPITGTSADIDGNFKISFPSNIKQIKVTMVGYAPKTITLDKKSFFEVKLEQQANEMEEVVVSGFFNKKKSSFTGAVKTITKEDIRKVSTGNIFTTLNNLDPSFKIQENNDFGSDPNRLPEFNIRGKGSFQNSATSPIFIVDGFQVSAEKVFDMDMERIESINILKDASATILYGSRAANGVIVIETRAPKPGKLRVTYNFKPTMAIVDLTDYSLMNAQQKLEYERLAGVYTDDDLSDQRKLEEEYNMRKAFLLRGVDTYWLSQPVQNALSHTHSLFVEGGDKAVRYGIDLNYNKNEGVMKQSGRDRISVGFSLTYRIKDKVTIKNYASYSNVNAYNSPYGSFSTYARLNPYEPTKDSNGEYIPILSNGDANPLYNASLPFRSDDKTQSFENRLNIDWYIKEGLRLKGSFRIQKDDIAGDHYTSPKSSSFVLKQRLSDGSWGYLPVEKRGSLSLSDGESLNWSGKVTLSYNKTINKHTIFLGLGGEANYTESNKHGFSVTGFPNDKYSDPAFAMQFMEGAKASSSESITKAMGAFLNLNYIYDNRYFTDLSVRTDGSSRFGSENKFATFYSLGAGWNVHNEHFWSDDNIIDHLKLRASYGVTGNQEFDAYQAKTTYRFNTDQLYYKTITTSLMGFGNPFLKWQKQYMTNLGVEFGMFKGRIRANVEYYLRNTSGMLTNITVAPSLGFPGNSFKQNLGEIENKGLEFNINAVAIRDNANDFELSFSLQAASNKSKLLEISKELKGINDKNNLNKTMPGNVFEEGESMTALKAVKSLGIDPATGKEMYLTRDGKVTTKWDAKEKVICGDTEPKVFGNFTTNVFYKGWNLNAVMSYRFKADMYNSTLVARVEGADPNYNADTRVLGERWKNPGDHTFYKDIADKTKSYISSRFIEEENTVALKSLSVSYTFDKDRLKKLKLETLKLSFYMNDVFRISTIDQERGLTYPFARSYVLGLNLSF